MIYLPSIRFQETFSYLRARVRLQFQNWLSENIFHSIALPHADLLVLSYSSIREPTYPQQSFCVPEILTVSITWSLNWHRWIVWCTAFGRSLESTKTLIPWRWTEGENKSSAYFRQNEIKIIFAQIYLEPHVANFLPFLCLITPTQQLDSSIWAYAVGGWNSSLMWMRNWQWSSTMIRFAGRNCL